MRVQRPSPFSIFNPFFWLQGIVYLAFMLVFTHLKKKLLLNQIGPFDWVLIASAALLIAAPLKALAERWAIVQADHFIRTTVGYSAEGLPKGAFVLYLRPHWLDGSLLYRNNQWSIFPLSIQFWIQPRLISLDHLLARELRQTIFALGTRSMQLSTGSVVVENEWQQRMEKLIENALCIILVPGISPGLSWEFSEIQRKSCIDKLIVVQPPELSLPREVDSIREHWGEVCRYYSRQYNIRLPDFKGGGQVFQLLPPQPTSVSILRIIRDLHSALKKIR